jgi:hypothetical protein
MATISIFNGENYITVMHDSGQVNIAKAEVLDIRPFYDPISSKRDRVIMNMSSGKPAYVFHLVDVVEPTVTTIVELSDKLVEYMDDDTGIGKVTTTLAP